MKRVLADLKAYGRQFLRSKVGVFFTFGFPVLLILLFGAIFSGVGTEKITLPTQDKDGTTMSQMFVDALEATDAVVIEEIPDDVDIEDYVRDNSLAFALFIPEGFEQNVTMAKTLGLPGTVVNITLYGDQTQTTYNIASSVVSGVIDYFNYGITNRTIGFQTASVAPEEFEYIDYFIPGVVGFTIMTTPMFAMANMCTEYRSRGYFKLLGSTPLRKSEWLASKILWFLIVLYISFTIMLLVGIAAFGLSVSLTLVAIVIIAVGTLLFTSLGMLIGTVTKNPETSAAIANAIMFPMMFLSGTFFPLESMPGYLQSIATAMPLTYINEGLRDTMIYGNTNSALINLGIVVIIAIIMFVAAAKLMSWKKK
jgi:ABC-2 type transport system permease protein